MMFPEPKSKQMHHVCSRSMQASRPELQIHFGLFCSIINDDFWTKPRLFVFAEITRYPCLRFCLFVCFCCFRQWHVKTANPLMISVVTILNIRCFVDWDKTMRVGERGLIFYLISTESCSNWHVRMLCN